MTVVAKALIILGVLVFLGAVGWWYGYYEQFYGDEVKVASDCFYYFAKDCSPSMMEDLLSDVPAYSPVALWVSGALTGLGLLVLALTPFRR